MEVIPNKTLRGPNVCEGVNGEDLLIWIIADIFGQSKETGNCYTSAKHAWIRTWIVWCKSRDTFLGKNNRGWELKPKPAAWCCTTASPCLYRYGYTFLQVMDCHGQVFKNFKKSLNDKWIDRHVTFVIRYITRKISLIMYIIYHSLCLLSSRARSGQTTNITNLSLSCLRNSSRASSSRALDPPWLRSNSPGENPGQPFTNKLKSFQQPRLQNSSIS